MANPVTRNSERRAPSSLSPIFSFALANLKGSLKNRALMAVALLTPAMLILIFWLMSGAGQSSEFDIFRFIYPGIVVFTVIQTGGMHATTIVNWREQQIFRRLACTPVPLWKLVLGRSLSQLVLSLIQAFIIILMGALLLREVLSPFVVLTATLILTLSSACFIALGTIIAALSPNATIANTVYVFLIIPLLFLGDSMLPEDLLPRVLQRIGDFLPTAMTTDLVRPLLLEGIIPTGALLPIAGLLFYTLFFVLLSARMFRWE
ncbi:MAG: ABC transporter permease [Ardenticatenales bacterium]|nr:ABC transporter permease [Ardenticatenales bacterium]